jgi:hypothetical protein
MDEEIKLYWDEHFPGCPPVGYLFKQRFPDLWFRIHTLQESKRYPNNWDEYQEIFRRHNTLCSDLFSKSESIYLLLTQGSVTKKVISPKYIDRNIFSIRHMTSISTQEIEAEDDSQYFFHIWSFNFHWEYGFLDELFKKVANEEIRNLILIDTHSHRLYYPYDGGADIICASSVERDSYEIKYRTWLPDRQDGL